MKYHTQTHLARITIFHEKEIYYLIPYLTCQIRGKKGNSIVQRVNSPKIPPHIYLPPPPATATPPPHVPDITTMPTGAIILPNSCHDNLHGLCFTTLDNKALHSSTTFWMCVWVGRGNATSSILCQQVQLYHSKIYKIS